MEKSRNPRYGKFIAVPALAFSLALSLFAGTAYAWNGYVNHERYLNYNPTFWTNSQGAYTLYGYINVDWGSFMKASNTEGYSDPAEIQTQAMGTVGSYNGFQTTEKTLTGPFVANWNGSAKDVVTESSLTGSISQAVGVGEIGALSWGRGQVTANDGRVYKLPTYYHLLVTTIDGKYVAGPTVSSVYAANSAEWIPGSGNFVGEDGRSYGVAYIDDTGNLSVPDMLRVELGDGSFGYIGKDSMRDASLEGAKTQEEINLVAEKVLAFEAEALQGAFCQYYGIDALSYGDALECASLMRFEGGNARAAEIMESKTAGTLALGVNEGLVDEVKARSMTELENAGMLSASSGLDGVLSEDDICISESDFEAILDIAMPELTLSIPAYGENGVDVVGYYSFVRL